LRGDSVKLSLSDRLVLMPSNINNALTRSDVEVVDLLDWAEPGRDPSITPSPCENFAEWESMVFAIGAGGLHEAKPPPLIVVSGRF
jgi:hypothetical protein